MVRRASAETSSSSELVLASSRSKEAREMAARSAVAVAVASSEAREMAARSAVAVAVASSSAAFSASHSRIASPIPPPLGSLAIFELEHLPREFRHLRSHLLGAALPLLPFPHRVETLFELRLEPPRASRRGAGARPRARLALHHHHVRVFARFQERANGVTHHEDDKIGGESTRAEPERCFRLRHPSRAAEDARRAARARRARARRTRRRRRRRRAPGSPTRRRWRRCCSI